MNNKGQITIFLSLIISALLLLSLTAIQAININLVKEKCTINSRSIVSTIKSEYESYVFENYHILLLDKSFGGLSEEEKEESLKELMQENLGSNIILSDLNIVEYKYLMDEECKAFKAQIAEYMTYAAIETSFDSIIEKIKGSATVTDELLEDMENADEIDEEAVSSNNEAIKSEDVSQESEGTEVVEDEACQVEDPREFTASLMETGILSVVLPEGLEVSNEEIDLSGVPSQGTDTNFDTVSVDFSDLDVFTQEIAEGGSLLQELEGDISGVLYANDVFNCALDYSVNEETVFLCEREYLIIGKNSDYENLEGVVHKLTALRLPVNFIYLLSDGEKMSLIEPIAAALFAATKIPAEVYKYLIAGCWSYVEALAEVKMLLSGSKVEFIKTKENWITDLDNLQGSINSEKRFEKGLSYEDYLMLLLAVDTDNLHIRMLDLIQLNTAQHNKNFKIENAITGITIETESEYLGKKYSLKISGNY